MSIESSLNRAEIAIQVRDNWLKRYQEPPLINKEKAVNAINWLYKLGGLKEPKIIFCDSPKQCKKVYLKLANNDYLYDEIVINIQTYTKSKTINLRDNAIRLLVNEKLRNRRDICDIAETFSVVLGDYLDKCMEILIEDKRK